MEFVISSLLLADVIYCLDVFNADRIQDAIQELGAIKDKRDVSLCTLMALVYAEKKRPHPGEPLSQSIFRTFIAYLPFCSTKSILSQKNVWLCRYVYTPLLDCNPNQTVFV